MSSLNTLPTRLSSDLVLIEHDRGTFASVRWIFINQILDQHFWNEQGATLITQLAKFVKAGVTELWLKTTYRSEEHTSELQSRCHLVCRLLLEINKNHY